MVDKKNMPTRRPSTKLYHKKAGPFQIMKIGGKRAYRLKLPEGNRTDPTYHVHMLESYRRSAYPTRQLEPPQPESINGEENWVVREIVDSRRNNRKKRKPTEYLVLWESYTDEEATWEPYENIKGTAAEALAEYQAKNLSAKEMYIDIMYIVLEDKQAKRGVVSQI